ncbi:cell number regulator 7-like [Carica papaya]|uniref:cell number regulator 7-like n=1 Tax=Carica papaya TaxID=3649 RepID=UPI000B8CB740|nr:cell number regulator 7-like [Carica papaya]
MNVEDPNSEEAAEWSVELCGCGGDVGTCLLTCCVPCVIFGQIAQVLDEGSSSCFLQGCMYGLLMACSCHWLLSCAYRGTLRRKLGLPPLPCNDCCVHFCCEPCALCQEHAELKRRRLLPTSQGNGSDPPHAPPQPPTM